MADANADADTRTPYANSRRWRMGNMCTDRDTDTDTETYNTRCANSRRCRMAVWFRWLRLGGLVEVVYCLGFRWFSLGGLVEVG